MAGVVTVAARRRGGARSVGEAAPLAPGRSGAVTPGAVAEAIRVATAPLEAPTATLGSELGVRLDPKAHAYWTNLMKGEAVFLGVPMAGVRASVRRVWAAHDLDAWPIEDLLALAQRWFAGDASEEQLAAVLLLAEHLHDRLRLDHVDALAAPLAAGQVRDWNVTDWYATKALHAFLTAAGDPARDTAGHDGAARDDLEARARALAAWTTAPALWQRRAGLVAFVKLAPRAAEAFDGFVPLVLEACANNLAHEGRFAHTGPGWVLRELSRAVPDAVATFVEAHPEMSVEARRMATARLRSGPYRRR